MRFDVFTLFPEIFMPYLETSILQRARQRGLIEVNLYNIRDWTSDRHHITDDEPYGGGGGMVMKPEPIFAAVEAVAGSPPVCPVILLTPQGRVFTQTVAMELVAAALGGWPFAALRAMEEADAQGSGTTEGNEEINETDMAQEERSLAALNTPDENEARLALLCGRYEGIDERVREHLVTDEISIGDYVITGGELAALIVIDAVTRLIPGALGDPEGAADDSHAMGLLEYPHFTRPAEFRGWRVPDVLLSGDHGKIARWRREQALLRTRLRRPDILARAELTKEDRKFLENTG